MRPRVVAAMLVLATTGCVSRAGHIAVKQGEGPRTADFVYEPPPEAEATSLRVIEVDGGPFQPSGRGRSIHEYVWYVARVNDTAPQGRTVIHFGQVPSGMVEARPAQPLAPGWYAVRIRAGRVEAAAQFRVTKDGRVESIDGPPNDR